MDDAQKQAVHTILTDLLKGDASAVEYCMMLYKIAHTWDDLIDKDKPIADADINKTFMITLVDLPNNAFYRRYMDVLIPLQYSAILQWLTSNKMERMDLESKHKAFMLKASFIQIVHVCAGLVGGSDWAEEIGSLVWQLLYDEPLEAFLQEVQYA